ncbi:hypothetical protein EJB05_01686 [Eragrostis curvula]|uniref:Uncharacterized protein n=1 Tax=Eragrostis curvula TaxID=38414 RepID=A0A5J9WQ66_9POAL|nr:hypothetical protein EJB05_01686 [Eragrostis curvula]
MKHIMELADEAMRMVHERMGIQRDLLKLMENSYIELGLVGENMPLDGIERSKIISMYDMHLADLEQCVSNLSGLRDLITNFWNNLKAKKAAAAEGEDVVAVEDADREEVDSAEVNDPAAEKKDAPAEEEDTAVEEKDTAANEMDATAKEKDTATDEMDAAAKEKDVASTAADTVPAAEHDAKIMAA